MRPEHELSIVQIRRILRDIQIPSRPNILTDLLNERQKTDTNIKRFADICGSDMAISASLLKAINSSFFGMSQKINSVFQAVMLLGVRNVTNIVSGLCLRTAFEYGSNKLMESLWARSMECALVSARIAKSHGRVPSDDAYTLGLLCDCGIPLMIKRFEEYPARYHEWLNSSERSITETEHEVFEIHHAQAGFSVAVEWEFSELIGECIMRHHDIYPYRDEGEDSTAARMMAVLKVAEQVSRRYNENPPCYEWVVQEGEILDQLGIPQAEYEEFEESLVEMLKEYYL